MPGTHTNLIYHLVFSTKSRVPMITPALTGDLYRYLGGIVRGEGGVLLDVGGMPDHIHLLVKLRPTLALADLLRLLKTNSSKWANENRASIRKFAWQDGYAAFTVGESQLARVARYIRQQEQHHKRTHFRDELRELLQRHGVEFDERFL
jgi:putative transposase